MAILVASWPLQNSAASAERGDPILNGLVDRLQRGDSSALEPLITRTQKMAFRLACSILGDPHQAEDVLQDTYLTVYQSIGQLRESAAFRGWFCRILINRCHRLKRGQRPDSLEDLTVEPSQPCQSEQIDRRLEVAETLSSLSAPDRTVLALRDILQMSYEEIASTLDVPLTTVKARLFKARQRFLSFFQKGARS